MGIGFQGYWQRIQHPLGGNLLEKAYRSCKRNEINVCAVNSQDSSEVIEKGSVHDRLNYLQNSLDSKLERKGYSVEMDGDNVMVVYKDGENPVYFLNSQTVTSKEGVETLVVGRNEPVIVYDLMDKKNMVSGKLADMVEKYNQGLALYKARNYQDAISSFNSALKIFPGDGPSITYIERCNQFIETPPAPDWNGVYRHTEKG